MMHRRLVPLLVLILLAGCGSPTTFLTLSAQNSPRGYDAPGAPVAVAAVAIPPDLDQSSYLTMASDYQLKTAPNTSWAAPLGGIIQRALARDLAGRLRGATVIMPGDQIPSGGVRLVKVNVGKFIADKAGLVTLDADWSVISTASQNDILAQDRAHITVQGKARPAAEAQSMSIALGQMADQIAARL